MSAFTEKREELLGALHESATRYEQILRKGFHAGISRITGFPIQTICRAVQTRFFSNRKNFIVSNHWFFGGQGTITSTEYDLWYVGALCAPTELETARFIAERLHPGATFFDIGSHHGYYAMLANQLLNGTNGVVVAFEPSPFHFGLLHSNAMTTGIVAEQIALGDYEGPVEFYQSRFGTSTLHSHLVNRKKYAFEEISVQCESLDRYCDRTGKQPDILKIDIEGNEYALLCGARELIARLKPDIVMEVWGGAESGAYEAAVDILLEHGYVANEYVSVGLVPILKQTGKSVLIGRNDIRNIFFIHPDRTEWNVRMQGTRRY